VIPTLVAVRTAPRNTWAIVGSCGRSHAPTAQPRKNGVTTPSTATSAEERPTRSISFTVDWRPTSNISTMIPREARI